MTQVSFDRLPGMSRLFLDYTSDWTKVQRFYRNSYTLDSIVNFGRRRLERGLPHRDALCQALAAQQTAFGGKGSTVDRLSGGAVAIVTGQQPGLFTGPLYTMLKAISVIKLAKAVTDAGLDAVPVFWVASEDHDYEEIHWASILDRDSGLRKLRVDLGNSESSPVGWLKLKDDAGVAIEECLANLPPSEFQPELRGVLESTYQAGLSPAESFARMMVQLFGESGLIVVDPLHPDLKAIARPALQEVVKRNEELRRAVLARSREVSQAGYHEQVKVDANFTGLFGFRGQSRQALRPGEIQADLPLSPNVLVRPVIQDTIFPTAAFVAGPAEIAYLAQAAAVYETMGVEQTPVYPRISATLIEGRVARALKKYDLQLTDALQGKEFVKRRAVGTVPGAELFKAVKDNLSASLESLRPALNAVDSTLAGALDTAKQKAAHQVETLETKFINAEAKRNEVMEKQLDLVVNSLFPEKKLQERLLNVTSFAARYGLGFLDRLEKAVLLDSTQHQVVDI